MREHPDKIHKESRHVPVRTDEIIFPRRPSGVSGETESGQAQTVLHQGAKDGEDVHMQEAIFEDQEIDAARPTIWTRLLGKKVSIKPLEKHENNP